MSIRPMVKSALGEKNVRVLRQLKRQLTGRPAAPVKPTGLDAISHDLNKLAVHFKTDKWGTHRYTQHYQRHLQHLKNKKFNLLEIGIGGYSRAGQGGASLRMWKAFFPNAHIFGMDIHDKSFVDEDRITTFIGDQSDPDSLNAVADKIGEIDVIIDDGSHRSPHVITTFETLFPRLKDGGIYAVEDTQSSYWPEWMGSEDLDAKHTSMGMLKRLTDGLNYEEFVDESYEPTYTDRNVVGVHFYHNLVIIEKGKNAEGSNKRSALKQRYAKS
ncbi:class I SAM-dependent methyltransferase [Streptomyces sp. NPDC052013]|uniref:class I SAM-dependent methyltransferase n=1 Tax=Streptomyces sp. NPDC052013 TaxID=3365679 RepID=UPI0037D0C1E3